MQATPQFSRVRSGASPSVRLLSGRNPRLQHRFRDTKRGPPKSPTEMGQPWITIKHWIPSGCD